MSFIAVAGRVENTFAKDEMVGSEKNVVFLVGIHIITTTLS